MERLSKAGNLGKIKTKQKPKPDESSAEFLNSSTVRLLRKLNFPETPPVYREIANGRSIRKCIQIEGVGEGGWSGGWGVRGVEKG